MDEKQDLPVIGSDDFARRFSLRAANLMWLLGAGASASAGIPTASDMIWEFKQRLFISQRRVRPQAVADLSSPAVRAQLQAHIESSGNLPTAESADEYAAPIEAVYPAEVDRRAYLDARMTGARGAYFQGARSTPRPVRLVRHVGHGPWDDTARAALALSKMDWNNDALYDPLPVTIGYAKVLARVVRRMRGLGSAPYQSRFFM